MQILLAPDKFKGTLTAGEAARAMRIGVLRAIPHAIVDECPIADGGQGTLSVLAYAGVGRIESVRVIPDGGSTSSQPVLILRDGSTVIEAASTYPDPDDLRRPLDSSSILLGRLIEAATARPEVRSVSVGVGGTLSTDGGTGAASACGWRFLDRAGAQLRPGGGALVDLARIVPPSDGTRVKVASALCDVDVPLTGRGGSARAFAPQKGASEEEVSILEEGLVTLEGRIRADLGIDTAGMAFAGAGGGLGAGLAVFFRADLRSGFDHVAEAVGLIERVRAADVVVTGEGRLDLQSLAGKAPLGTARLARNCGVPCLVVTGANEVDDETLRADGIRCVGVLEDPKGDAAGSLADATAVLLEEWSRT